MSDPRPIENQPRDEREAELVAAITRIFRTRVYEDGKMAKGISVEMVGAINRAAEVAGITGPPHPWTGLGMLEQPDPADVKAYREWVDPVVTAARAEGELRGRVAEREQIRAGIEALPEICLAFTGRNAYDKRLVRELLDAREGAHADYGVANPVCPEDDCERTGRCCHGTCPRQGFVGIDAREGKSDA